MCLVVSLARSFENSQPLPTTPTWAWVWGQQLKGQDALTHHADQAHVRWHHRNALLALRLLVHCVVAWRTWSLAWFHTLSQPQKVTVDWETVFLNNRLLLFGIFHLLSLIHSTQHESEVTGKKQLMDKHQKSKSFTSTSDFMLFFHLHDNWHGRLSLEAATLWTNTYGICWN